MQASTQDERGRWRIFRGVRRGERERFVFFFRLALLLSAAQTLGIAGTDALFLVRLGPEALPAAFILAALATVAGSFVYALLVGQSRNDNLFVGLLLTTSAVLLAVLWGIERSLDWSVMLLFCLLYFFQAVFVCLHYWTFAADYFDSIASKRLFPLFAVGASLGGVVGGILASLLGRLSGSSSLILAWVGLLLLAAGYIRWTRTRLRGWTPVGAVEADESSLRGLVAAVRYIRRSPMAFGLLISVMGMVFALTLAQYLYLDIFSKSFRSAEELAAFFGAYLAITNAIEIAVGNGLTPWLIRRFGVAQANLAHPTLTLLSLLGLALDPRLAIAVVARANRELLENALAGPIRALSYNALPYRFRGRMRALLEGIVSYGTMSLAGVALLLFGDQVAAHWLAIAGGLGALIYALANMRVRREYLANLIAEVHEGRIDLTRLRGQLGAQELSSLVRHWEAEVSHTHGALATGLIALAKTLAAQGHAGAVARQARHPDPALRGACLDALGAQARASHEVLSPGHPTLDLLEQAQRDEAVSVRRSAAIVLGELVDAGCVPMELAVELARARREEADPVVRAELAGLLGPEGDPILLDLLARPEEASVVAALAHVPSRLRPEIALRLEDPRPLVHAAAIRAGSRLSADEPPELEDLVRDLHHVHPAVREAAAFALANRLDDASVTALAGALDDVSRNVRVQAEAALATLGDTGVLAAAPYARGPRVWTVEAALGAVARAGGAVATALLQQCYRDRVRDAWLMAFAREQVPIEPDLASRFLIAALDNAHRLAVRLAFRVLARLEDADVVRSLERSLGLDRGAARANALEVLSNLGDRDASSQLALLLEDGAIDEKRAFAIAFVSPPEDLDAVLQLTSASRDRWLQIAADRYLRLRGSAAARAAGDEARPSGTAAHALPDKEAELMERLLALQSVPLFGGLTLEQLSVIDPLLQQMDFMAGELIIREGEPGDELYVLIEGEVRFFKAFGTDRQQLLSSMTPVGSFGEIAVLDDEVRSATVQAVADSRLLALSGPRLKELILQAPEISFEIFPALIEKIRAAESRIVELVSDASQRKSS